MAHTASAPSITSQASGLAQWDWSACKRETARAQAASSATLHELKARRAMPHVIASVAVPASALATRPTRLKAPGSETYSMAKSAVL